MSAHARPQRSTVWSRFGTTGVLGVCVGAGVIASAAALGGVGSDALSAGTAPIVACDPDGFTVTQDVSGSDLTGLTIGDIHVDCTGAELIVTLADGPGAVVATIGPATIPGASAVLAVSPTVDVGDFANHHIVVVGP